jgi:hypothetical protein
VKRAISLPNKQYDEDGDAIKFNRAGATTVIGGAYFLDEKQSATGSGNQDQGMSQLILPTTALIANRPRLVIANEAIATAGDPVKCTEGEAVVARIKVDGSGTAIAKGDKLKPQNNSATMVKATLTITGGAVGDAWYAVAGAASTANGDIIPCLLYSEPRL